MNLPSLGVKSVQNYLRVVASHATNNGQCDTCIRYTPSVLPLDGAKPFLVLQKLLSRMSKWKDGREDFLLLTTAILVNLEACSSSGGHSSKGGCIFDAICLGLQTGSRCNEYCRGNPTSQSENLCKVPISAYAGTFAGYLIAFINACWDNAIYIVGIETQIH